MAMMGAAIAAGENRAIEAAQRAISSPLLEDVKIEGALLLWLQQSVEIVS
jgi:cell division protein FtsZ